MNTVHIESRFGEEVKFLIDLDMGREGSMGMDGIKARRRVRAQGVPSLDGTDVPERLPRWVPRHERALCCGLGKGRCVRREPLVWFVGVVRGHGLDKIGGVVRRI